MYRTFIEFEIAALVFSVSFVENSNLEFFELILQTLYNFSKNMSLVFSHERRHLRFYAFERAFASLAFAVVVHRSHAFLQQNIRICTLCRLHARPPRKIQLSLLEYLVKISCSRTHKILSFEELK